MMVSPTRRAAIAIAATGSLLAVVAAALGYFTGQFSPDAIAAPRSFAMHEAPRPLPEIAFEDGSGQRLTLADFKGKTVLLNIWATWCVPCREEMPTLDALQAELGGAGFEVVPLSIDRAGPEAVRRFYDEIAIRHLGLYIDASMQAASDLGTLGLPTTLLIDEQGRELGQLVGATEWNAPEMIAFLKTHLISN